MHEPCRHISQEFRPPDKGLWCCDCGEQIYAVENRKCGDCRCGTRPLTGGVICQKQLMRVTDDLCVTYRVVDGTCWEPQPSRPAAGGAPAEHRR